MKYGLNTDGRKCGPIDPAKVNDAGWSWFDTDAERDAAIPEPTQEQLRAQMSCSAVAGEIILHRQGLLDAVKQRAANDPEFDAWFRRATTWRRTSPILIDAYVEINGSEDGLDKLFEAAKEIDE